MAITTTTTSKPRPPAKMMKTKSAPSTTTTTTTTSSSSSLLMKKSITLHQIHEFWQRKRLEEEEHLVAAQKSAARIRARSLTEREYKMFEERLMRSTFGDEDEKEEDADADADHYKDLPPVIKDWWTKSKYAYLNQPAIKYMEKNALPRRTTSGYTPQDICCYFSTKKHQQFIISSLGVH
ncbi:uncharacterized protein LOC120275878 [Dioscorea cayenensis subsp. rotundata]|uniref:Uncharacterized protein LOC120275878 n=1 Tax=Dioscorea cayennensis subsp. rotundata TaxID=55577 RepID=A0AB40CGJ3_DIOCR|nr:uncharacterized protein LOC120275878 [Dioscorea cayenensis subsp. rotundata]